MGVNNSDVNNLDVNSSDINKIEFNVNDYKVPTPGSWPGNNLLEDKAGWLWFTEMLGNKIGAVNIHNKEFREYELSSPSSMPVGLAVEEDGTLWAALFRGNSLAKINPDSGEVIEYPLAEESALPSSLVLDGKNRLWMTQLGANQISLFNPETASFKGYPLPRQDSNPMQAIYDAQRDALWISCANDERSYLAKLDLGTMAYDVFLTPTATAQPIGLMLHKGNVWVAQGGAGSIAKFTPDSGQWKEFKLPGDKSQPVKLALDNQERIWVSDGGGMGDVGGNQVAVFDQNTEQFDVVEMPVRGAKPMGITFAQDGNIWFTQQGANRISQIDIEGI